MMSQTIFNPSTTFLKITSFDCFEPEDLFKPNSFQMIPNGIPIIPTGIFENVKLNVHKEFPQVFMYIS